MILSGQPSLLGGLLLELNFREMEKEIALLDDSVDEGKERLANGYRVIDLETSIDPGRMLKQKIWMR